MCLAIPGKITKVEGHKATVKYPGEERVVFLGDEKVRKGDYVMVQMGIVIKVLPRKEAFQSLKAWKIY
jgi:hydrogenase expression/formation protein HypC